MILIKNAVVLTMDEKRQVYMDGALAIDGDMIAAVGKTEELLNKYDYDRVIDAKDKLVMPGFVNAHVHLFQTLYRGMGDDLLLADWLAKCIYPLSYYLDEDASRVGAELSALEMLRTGVTTYVDSHYITRDKRCYDGIAQGTLNTGIRGVIGRSTVNSTDTTPEPFRESIDVAQRECARVIEAYHNHPSGLLSVRVEPLNESSATPDMVRAMYEVSRQYNVGMSMHLSETVIRYRSTLDRFGKTPVAYLNDLGVLGRHILLAHCVWLNPQDIAILKSTGSNVAYNSVSNQYLADGIANIAGMDRAGVSIALGADGAASNNSLNMFQVLKSAVLLQRANTLDVFSLTAQRVLEMATIDGARAIGMEDKIGSLEAGKKADVLMLSLNDVTMTPRKSCISNIVYSANTSAVDTVMVNGKILLEGGAFTSIDEQAVYRSANQTLDRLAEKSGYTFQPCTWPIVS